MSKWNIYTDGACSGNPGKAGWAFIAINEEEVIKQSGTLKLATNNIAELYSIVQALKHIQSISKVKDITIYSDSAYCINPINQGWIYSWEKNKWKTKEGSLVKNVKLWKELLEMIKFPGYSISFIKVKGHSGNKYNEEADRMAKEARMI